VLAYSWNWIGGYAGYTHFGQVGFFGIGAYVGSLLNFHYGVPWYLAALVAGLAGAIVALPLGGVMLRLKGPFFAIGMFGLARVMEAFALGFDSITGGGTGIYLKPVSDLRPIYGAVAAVAFIMLILTWKLDNSRLGRFTYARQLRVCPGNAMSLPNAIKKAGCSRGEPGKIGTGRKECCFAAKRR
jgi:branched-chain amino acid transport system permease protein